MNPLTTAKDALLVEALGEFGQLLNRADKVQRTLAESSRELSVAQTRLKDQLVVFDTHVTELTEKAKVLAVKHILARTDEAARRSIELQSREMTKAGQEVFIRELQPALARVSAPLSELVQQLEGSWTRWWIHAATAMLSSGLTLMVSAWVLR